MFGRPRDTYSATFYPRRRVRLPQRDAAGGAAAPPRRGLAPRLNWVTAALGIVLVLGGMVFIGLPFLQAAQRGSSDHAAVQAWQQPQVSNIQGAAPDSRGGAAAATPPPHCGSGTTADFALVTFPTLQQYGYAGVAGNGDWSLLLQRSMVHWASSAAPGQQGNMIIAFHREPGYQHIDQLGVGGLVDVQDRSCHTWTYRVTQRWQLAPDRVTQLVTTDPNHDLTMITCTPFWIDSDRLVWRATLVAEDGRTLSA